MKSPFHFITITTLSLSLALTACDAQPPNAQPSGTDAEKIALANRIVEARVATGENDVLRGLNTVKLQITGNRKKGATGDARYEALAAEVLKASGITVVTSGQTPHFLVQIDTSDFNNGEGLSLSVFVNVIDYVLVPRGAPRGATFIQSPATVWKTGVYGYAPKNLEEEKISEAVTTVLQQFGKAYKSAQ
jgi:hypothetical protein